MNGRPLIITLLGWLLILLGTVEFVVRAAMVHPSQFHSARDWLSWDALVPLFELVILLCGVFLLRRHNWARWLALGWIGFHVAISSLHTVLAGILHGLIFLAFAWLLFRPEINAWFRVKDRVRGQTVQ